MDALDWFSLFVSLVVCWALVVIRRRTKRTAEQVRKLKQRTEERRAHWNPDDPFNRR